LTRWSYQFLLPWNSCLLGVNQRRLRNRWVTWDTLCMGDSFRKRFFVSLDFLQFHCLYFMDGPYSNILPTGSFFLHCLWTLFFQRLSGLDVCFYIIISLLFQLVTEELSALCLLNHKQQVCGFCMSFSPTLSSIYF
jgi:hypothetical protein